MPHKIKITGKPISKLREANGIYSFDMEEGGSPSAPKGLYKSSRILYTVFINKKQFNKLKIDKESFKDKSFFIEGEPTLDVPMDICPGEIGITTFQIQSFEPKVKEPKEKPKEAKPEPKKDDVQVTCKTKKSSEKRKNNKDHAEPSKAEEVVPIEKIKCPEHFTEPNPLKVNNKMEYYKEHGKFIKPITVNKSTMEIEDGYTVYVAAKKLNKEYIEVIYQS
jgi:hypothetical protein